LIFIFIYHVGILYRNIDTGSWRAVKLANGILLPPGSVGWQDKTYYAVTGDRGSPESSEGIKRPKLSSLSPEPISPVS